MVHQINNFKKRLNFPRLAKPWKMSSRWSFSLVVLLPTLLVCLYYLFISSDQYRSEALFAVRGTVSSPLSVLGLSALPGANTQAGDSYIVADYLKSKQVIIDAIHQRKIDIRKFYSKNNVDFLYRVEPNIPFEEFESYWTGISEVEFNSTTGITTFRVKAFTAEDAHLITQTVMDVSENLVNRLSDNARQQLISTARVEVERIEQRLRSARQAVQEFRNKEQAFDPQLIAQSEQSIIRELQASLADLQSRRNALLQTTTDSPTLRVIDRRIAALQNQIGDQKQRLGSGTEDDGDMSTNNLSRISTDYSTLLLEQEFAEKAYTSAQTALEQALTEARKQDRYFALVVSPSLPDASMYPKRLLNSLMIFAGLFLAWLIGFLIIQSVRDHEV